MFKPAGQICDEGTDCQRESVCSGFSPLCPEPSAKENLTVCSQGTRVCFSGVRQPRPLHSVTQCASFPSPDNLICGGSVQQCCQASLVKKKKRLALLSFKVQVLTLKTVQLAALELSIMSHDLDFKLSNNLWCLSKNVFLSEVSETMSRFSSNTV